MMDAIFMSPSGEDCMDDVINECVECCPVVRVACNE